MTACRSCGTELLENARFCHGCGSALAAIATRAEYKQVTVLFTDVVRSMDIAAAVGTERLREIVECSGRAYKHGRTPHEMPGRR
jgi:class 3 adenylate cyclase